MSVAIVACRDGSNLKVQRRAELTIIDDLCAGPGKLASVPRIDRLVLVLHRDHYVPAQIQKHARELGIDPIGVQIVHWDEAHGSAHRLGVMIAAAAARAAASVDATPQQLKPVLPNRLNRRSLLSLPRPVYVAVPEIDEDACVAVDGCKACVAECPSDAYSWVGGRIVYDKEACVSCGRCVSGCPAGAIASPAISPAVVHSAIHAMVEAASKPVGVAFMCGRRTESAPGPGWYPLEVPCASMVPGTWPVAALMIGAGAARIVPCTDVGCSLAHDEIVAGSMDAARALLEASGIDAELVPQSWRDVPETPRFGTSTLVDPFGVRGPHETVVALAALVEREIRIEHDRLPVGIVDIDPSACTMCMKCASVCPADALRQLRESDELLLTFNAARCTACGQCTSVCPEVAHGAIECHHRIDSTAILGESTTLNRATAARCEICGGAIAPAPMLERIASILGSEHAATVDYLNRRCLNCRGS